MAAGRCPHRLPPEWRGRALFRRRIPHRRHVAVGESFALIFSMIERISISLPASRSTLLPFSISLILIAVRQPSGRLQRKPSLLLCCSPRFPNDAAVFIRHAGIIAGIWVRLRDALPVSSPRVFSPPSISFVTVKESMSLLSGSKLSPSRLYTFTVICLRQHQTARNSGCIPDSTPDCRSEISGEVSLRTAFAVGGVSDNLRYFFYPESQTACNTACRSSSFR